MPTSRLERSSVVPLRDVNSIIQYCDKHEIPYSQQFHDKILTHETLRNNFVKNYSLSPLPAISSKSHGTSTVVVFETKREGSNHGEVGSAIAQEVGSSLVSPVETIYIHRSLNPNYRTAYEKKSAEAVSSLVENQGVAVLQTSIGWDDRLLDFDLSHDNQANHLWRATAYIVDAAGNDGRNGPKGNLIPFQKHNALSHFSPLVVHVGAASRDKNQEWCIEGYSSANSPTFLAPVASRTNAVWREGAAPEPLTGTSVAAPYVSGVLAAFNYRYGAYLTREQILYALIATCTPVERVNAFSKQTPEALKISYKKNSAGLSYNPEYGGFGLVHPHNADKLLSHMVALTQAQPQSITVPTEERVTVLGENEVKPDEAGLYHYTVTMPAGFALKTTVEVDFKQRHGAITITSPSGTTLPMVMSALNSRTHHFGMSTSHGWAGEPMSGTWTIASTTPINRLRLNQHHFLEHDIIHTLDVQKLLRIPSPDLQHAVPIHKLNPSPVQRILHDKVLPQSAEPKGLRIGADGKPPVLDNVADIIAQLKTLPSGFKTRHRKAFLPGFPLNKNTKAGQLELEAIELVNSLTSLNEGRDEIRHKAIEKQLAAAAEYEASGKLLEQIIPLCNAGFNCLACENVYHSDGSLNAEKAIPIYTKALRICKSAGLYTKAYEISCNLYTALSRTCEYGKVQTYGRKLEGVRKEALRYSREVQGLADIKAHRIEEGEYGISNHDKIGTDNVSQCITIIAHDPITLKTGVAHVDNENDISTLDEFFSPFGENRLKLRLVGARFDRDFRTNENISAVMKYLSRKNADIISADIYGGNDGPSTVVVDPLTFTIEEKVPARHNGNEAISNAIILLTRKGKPLIKQFDLTYGYSREPIHLNARMLADLRKNYFGKEEWKMEGYLGTQGVYDRPLLVTHMHALEKAYNEVWKPLSEELNTALRKHNITGMHAQQARDALLNQSLYIGENAAAKNRPVVDWIRSQLIKDGSLQRAALKGPAADINIYDPAGPSIAEGHLGQQQLRRNAQSSNRRE